MSKQPHEIALTEGVPTGHGVALYRNPEGDSILLQITLHGEPIAQVPMPSHIAEAFARAILDGNITGMLQ